MKKKIIMLLSLVILMFPISVFAEDSGVLSSEFGGNYVLKFWSSPTNASEVCPLGPDVTKDLYGVLMILKIVAPLLCIFLSLFDAIKAITKGDPASDLKVVAKKFFKRMIYALILFFIPVIVDLFFQMTDVWDANGTCDLLNVEAVEQSSTTKSTNENCSAIKDKDTCNQNQKCKWNNKANKCKALKKQ